MGSRKRRGERREEIHPHPVPPPHDISPGVLCPIPGDPVCLCWERGEEGPRGDPPRQPPPSASVYYHRDKLIQALQTEPGWGGKERRRTEKREGGCRGHSRSLSPGISKSRGAGGGRGWSCSPGCPTLSPPFLLLLTAAQLLSDSSSASRSQVKKAVTDLRATPLPCCSAGSLLDSHL